MGKSLRGKELGEGISQRKDGLYMGRFINRFGKRQTLYDKTISGLRFKMKEAQFQDDHQKNLVSTKMTLDEWFDFWITTFKQHCRSTTIRTYTIQYNRLREDLGWRTLSSLNTAIIQTAFNKLASDKMRCDCRSVLVDMMNCAIDSDLVAKNYAIKVRTKIDNKLPQERRILSEEETNLLFGVMRESSCIRKIVLLSLQTGMRIGEILGLCWDCVDFQNNMVYVRRNLVYLPNGGTPVYQFNEPKTHAGIRNIPMTKEVKVMLLNQKLRSNLINTRHAPQPGFEDLVFTSDSNHPLHESNVRSSLLYYVDKINRENPGIDFKPFSMHSLRHTFATRCIAAGMKPKVLQKIMGHSSIQITMDLYCHVEEEILREEMGIYKEIAQ